MPYTAPGSIQDQDPELLVIRHGNPPKLVRAFWHDDRVFPSPDAPSDRPRDLLTIYTGTEGDVATADRRTPYLHLVVQDLFDEVIERERIATAEPLPLSVDVFCVDAEDLRQASVENTTEGISLHKWLQMTAAIDLGGIEQPASMTNTRVAGAVTWSGRAGDEPINETGAVDLSRRGPDRLTHVCFPLPIPQTAIEKLSAGIDLRVGAWAWMLHNHAKKEYAETRAVGKRAGVRISSRDSRMEFLKSETKTSLLSRLTDETDRFDFASARDNHRAAQDGRDPSGHGPYLDDDVFHYDEPVCNGLRYRRALPVSSFFVGSQPGDIGLCNDHQISCAENPDLRATLSFSSYDDPVRGPRGGKHSSLPLLVFVHRDPDTGDMIDSRAPTFPSPIDFTRRYGSSGENGSPSDPFPFPVNEVLTSGESLYLFREGSAAAWLNTTEMWIRLPPDAETGEPGEFIRQETDPGMWVRDSADGSSRIPFRTDGEYGSVQTAGFDACIHYPEAIKGYTGPYSKGTLGRVVEQRALDLGRAASVHVLPPQTLETDAGEFTAHVGKGLPDVGFLPTTHTKVRVDADERDDVWEAHPFCHRPVIVSYRLERDLTSTEVTAWNERPPQLLLSSLDLKGEASIDLPIEDAQAVEGEHAILLYLTAPFHLSITMKSNNLVDVAPNPPGLRRASLFHFNARSASQDFSTFRPQGEGLFTPSPILSVDHVTAEEQLRQDVRSLREKHRKLETDALWEAGSVVAKITAGRVAVLAIDVLRRQVELLDQLEGAIEAARNRSLRNRVIGHLFGAETVFAPAALSVAEGVTALDVFYILTDVRPEIRDIERRLRARLSPFQRDAAESGATYSVIVVSGTETRRRVHTSPEGVASHQEEIPRSVAVVCSRYVDPQRSRGKPFRILLGRAGGRIERPARGGEGGSPSGGPPSWNSLERALDGFYESIGSVRHRIESAVSGQSRLRVGDVQTLLADIGQERPPWNTGPAFNTHLMGHLQSPDVQAALRGSGSADEAARTVVEPLMTFWSYIDVHVTRCPVCRRPMDRNWGWCPYHATPLDLGLDREDMRSGTDGPKEAFIQYVEERHAGETISQHLQSSSTPPSRLFVHWTEFDVSRLRSPEAGTDSSGSQRSRWRAR